MNDESTARETHADARGLSVSDASGQYDDLGGRELHQLATEERAAAKNRGCTYAHQCTGNQSLPDVSDHRFAERYLPF